jgi:hypothetical protein
MLMLILASEDSRRGEPVEIKRELYLRSSRAELSQKSRVTYLRIITRELVTVLRLLGYWTTGLLGPPS